MTHFKRITILGSTGSIGTQALDIVARHPDRFKLVGLTAGKNIDLLFQQIRQFHPERVAVQRREDAENLTRQLNGSCKAVWGEEGLVEVATDPNADLVISAIVGAAGLKPTYQALRAGKNVALANKESLVIAGEVMTQAARQSGAELLPVDSEHNAIFQCLCSGKREEVRRLILTASGGPFLHRSKESLGAVTVEEALKHPNWKMGDKITIDSATLMNKGLELIEAHWLFGFPARQIDVQIHPQSIVHSMVEFRDGSVLAQLGLPDMRCAISYTMAYPERIESGVKSLSLPQSGPLSFLEPDLEKFPCLALARQVAEEGESLPVVLNAANEVAVEKFLKREIRFLDIARLVEQTLHRHHKIKIQTIDDVLQVDQQVRESCR